MQLQARHHKSCNSRVDPGNQVVRIHSGCPRRPSVIMRAAFDQDPFAAMRQMDALMARQMAAMDQEMDIMSRQMDMEINRALSQTRDLERQLDKQLEQARNEIITSQPGVQIRRSEERGSNSYRYYESISITSMPQYHTAVNQAAAPSPWLFVAALLAGAYAALAAAFRRNIHLTIFKEEGGWKLALMWPVLLVTNNSFRTQFVSAIQGVKAPVKETVDAQDQDKTL